MTAITQTTSIASWGNSEAVRLPKDILRTLGLSVGDAVRISTTKKGTIEINPLPREHRRAHPARGITFETIFENYTPPQTPPQFPWGDNNLIGAEAQAWSN